MKKNILALSVALAVGSISCAYAAVPQTGTVGVIGGFSFLEKGANQYVRLSDRKGYGVGAYFGYDFTSWFGVEAAYQYFGGFQAYDKVEAKNDVNLSVRGPQFVARFAYPLSETGSDIYLRAGGMYAQGNLNGEHDNNWRPVVGAGVQYVFENGFGMRAGYDHVFKAVNVEPDANGVEVESDLGYAYVGLQYTFGRPAPAPEPAPAPAPAAPQQYNYSLDAGALFPFDGSKLSDDGINQIAGVVADVKAQNLNDVSYDVKGYTDRIGSDQYNLKLSEKRAQAVTDALVANGVDASKVTSAGYGEADPVTGDKCDGLSRAKLIECLGPDRRVEIVVQGEGTK